MKNAIILCSGGFDSVITSYYVKQKINHGNLILLFFDYNQRPLKQELFCVQKTAKALNAELRIIKLPWLGELSTSIINKNKEFRQTTDETLKDIEKSKQEIQNWYVPARNTIFLASALALAESLFIRTKRIYDIYTGLKNEGQICYKDTTPEFLGSINNLTKYATDKGDYKIIAPFIDADKDELIKIAKQLKVPLEFTYSCYIENEFKNNILLHCGKCLNCVLRKKAFYWAAEKDPTTYSI